MKSKFIVTLSLSFLVTLQSSWPKSPKNNYEEEVPAFYNIVGVAMFSGNGVGKVIQGVTNSNVSHVGLLISDAQDERKKYVSHATSAGVHITSWDKLIHDYNGLTNRGAITYRLFESKNDRMNPAIFSDYIWEYNGIKYPKNPLTLLFAALRINKNEELKKTSFFCSEYVAYMLNKIGYIDENTQSNNIQPKDFLEKTNKPISLSSGINLTPAYPAENYFAY